MESSALDHALMEKDFKDLQRSTVLLTLPGLFLAVLLLGSVASQTSDYVWPLGTSLFLIALMSLTWLASRKSFGLASLLLVAGTGAAVLMSFLWGGVKAALVLLFIPAGLATITFGGLAGASCAAAVTLWLVLGRGPVQAVDASIRTTAALTVWCGTGMIWLTLRPLLSVADWSWRAYRQSFRLLEQSREFQVRLQQALEDLTDANKQLNRLNALANNLRQAAEDERRTKEQFVANVSHELRTPLNMVIGFSEMILKAPEAYGQKLPANLLADLQVVLRNSQHLSSLINDVLDLSQIEARQMALVKEWVEVPEIVSAAMVAVRPLFDSKHLYLACEQPEKLPPVYCDRTRIREVLLNLLSNAGRFTAEGGVTIRVAEEPGGLLFSVADTGPGISEEDRQKLFKPFQQLDASIRRRHGGTGLGLSISKSFVEMHDGKMWVESQKGTGTTFFFRLPLEPQALTQSGYARWVNPYITYVNRSRRPHLPEAERRPRVLVVEKGSILQRLLRRYLVDMEVAAVQTLEEARAELERLPASVALINQAPELSGLDVLAGASGLPYDTPAVVCSVADPLHYAPAPEIPDILIKPISQEALTGALDKIDRTNGAGREIRSILLVEDDADAQKLFVRMLGAAGRGYRVVRAGNGVQALNLLARQKFDVILLDLIMPEMDGYQFLKMREQDPAVRPIPVILISAQDTRGHPIVSSFISATRAGGISVQQLLESVQALSVILNPATLKAMEEAASPTTSEEASNE